MDDSYRAGAWMGSGDTGPGESSYRRREIVGMGAKAAAAATLMPVLGSEPAFAQGGHRRGVARGRLGLVGTDHVGLTVPDIGEAVAWFKDVMGATDPLSFGP